VISHLFARNFMWEFWKYISCDFCPSKETFFQQRIRQ